MNTIHTSSLTHEIESYGGRQELLQFIQNRFQELAPGGIWVNRDVVGPENKNETVWMVLNQTDGRNDDFDQAFTDRESLASYLKGLSTYAKFLRFTRDFRKKESYELSYSLHEKNGESFVVLKLSDACEFMSRKDYNDNWESEMHETFTFWSFSEWKQHLEDAGFAVLPESAAYTNDWIVKNRFEGKLTLFVEADGQLQPLPYPVTNMMLLAEKR